MVGRSSRFFNVILAISSAAFLCLTRSIFRSVPHPSTTNANNIRNTDGAVRTTVFNAPSVQVSEYCAEKDILDLTSALHGDLQMGLRPWNVSMSSENISAGTTPTPIHHFRGLDDKLLQESFFGKRIILFGDSTTENMGMWLYFLLKFKSDGMSKNKTLEKNNGPLLPPLSEMTLDQANQIIHLYAGPNCPMGLIEGKDWRCKDKKNKHTLLDDGTEIKSIRGFRQQLDTGCTGSFDLEFGMIRDFKPDVIVANLGLWLFHFQKVARDQKLCVLETWVKYEGFLENMTLAAENAGAKILLFKTTNMICGKKYSKRYAVANRLYDVKNNKTLSECFADFKQQATTEFSQIADSSIISYCHNGIFNDIGSQHINQRLFRFIEERRNKSSIVLGLFNDYGIQSCNYTSPKDGRHYHPLNLVRIRLLGNVLSCLNQAAVLK